MERETYAGLAVVVILLIGSSAAAQTVDEGLLVSLRDASRRALPTDIAQKSALTLRTLASERTTADAVVTRSRISPASHAQIKRGSPSGRSANTVIAGVLGGLGGFVAGGFIGSAIRCSCSPEYFDRSVGAPIGAVVGGALAATYVHRRHRP